MCILFLYVNPKPSAGKFRLILAANRDEFYKRPTKPADFWEEDKTVIGGRDQEPGKEGGSWLALSARGRIAALLNIMHMGEHPPELLGRGSLVSDFVRGEQPGTAYINSIAVNSHKYRPFNFLTIEIASQRINVHKYCNSGEGLKENITSDYLGISNSFLDQPFAKVTNGLNQFRDIVQQFGMMEQKNLLNNKLLQLLKEDKRHFPDPILENFAPEFPAEHLKCYSSIYVKNTQRNYGTRAHAIITVGADNVADFSEWSMRDPIDVNEPKWESSHFSLGLQTSSNS